MTNNELWEIIKICKGKGGDDPDFESQEIETYCEIGVREGHTFQRRLPHVSQLAVAIDCWDLYEQKSQNDMSRERKEAKGQYENLKSYVKKNNYENGVKVIRGFSNDESIINQFDDELFDMIFIDGDHSYEGCKADLENWWPKIKVGKILCGHDYCYEHKNPNNFGVKKAVDEFIKKNKDSISNFRVHDSNGKNPNPTYYIQKRK